MDGLWDPGPIQNPSWLPENPDDWDLSLDDEEGAPGDGEYLDDPFDFPVWLMLEDGPWVCPKPGGDRPHEPYAPMPDRKKTAAFRKARSAQYLEDLNWYIDRMSPLLFRDIVLGTADRIREMQPEGLSGEEKEQWLDQDWKNFVRERNKYGIRVWDMVEMSIQEAYEKMARDVAEAYFSRYGKETFINMRKYGYRSDGFGEFLLEGFHGLAWDMGAEEAVLRFREMPMLNCSMKLREILALADSFEGDEIAWPRFWFRDQEEQKASGHRQP